VPLLADVDARTTVGNARAVAKAARELGADEVVVVTSRWHAPRARTLVRAALREPSVSVQSSSPSSRRPVALLARELVCLAALPYHLVRVRARR
jgi:uncharacterized SAM-binding protein YcdF (DUF218 family)